MNQHTSIQFKTFNAIDRFAYLIATGFGAGLMPKAPGTFGAIESVLVFVAAVALPLSPQILLILFSLMSLVSFAAGVWAANRVCKATGLDDPGQIVVDEICGQFIALVPVALAPSWLNIVLAFLLFRLFDITKPYPIRKLENFHGGLGVMADDVLAGIYAALLVWLAHLLHLV
ncbi:MAG: phosphatidylglycerophosphatase A [Acidobacteriota bacterium]